MKTFGLDIGTTSIGFAVIEYDSDGETGRIDRLGVRIFPEARDPDGTPLNQERRRQRLTRRQVRRRRKRRRAVQAYLREAVLLPAFGSDAWQALMRTDPYELRERALREALDEMELGRALYHLAKHRHFKGRDLEADDNNAETEADEKEAKGAREETLDALNQERLTLGSWLARRDPHTRKRGVHATREVVEAELEAILTAQSRFHAKLEDSSFREGLSDAILFQRPVFWRTNTLDACPFHPDEPPCPKGSWLSQQRRMLEKLNNLAVAGGNARPLDAEEREAILARLQVQASMTWGGVRAVLRPLFKARGEAGAEKRIKFNLELGGDKKLMGNAIEAKLVGIFNDDWDNHPHRQNIRDSIHERLWRADYEMGEQRVVILSARERSERRQAAVQSFIDDFDVARDQAEMIGALALPTGWEPYSAAALHAFMSHLEAGIRFGDLLNGPEWEEWRNETFPERDRPTGEVLDLLPSPARREERERIAKLRNPTVVRTQNELRKVVNNLIRTHGKPDLIRVEVARDVGKSKRKREEDKSFRNRNERRRRDAHKDLEAKGLLEPSRRDVEKWLLWKESRERCPYTGDSICFDALFRRGEFDVEHIWPRSRSFDDSMRNKTLCRRDINIEKGNRTPFEYVGGDEDRWSAVAKRLEEFTAQKGGPGMSPGKVKRFVAKAMPDDFTARQLNDTGYAARQAIAFLSRLWPDVGPSAPVTVQAVTGRVTAQLRRLWGLNNILADNGEKTRADHRHHAIDALVVACTHPGMTQKLSRYWQGMDEPGAERPELPPPWSSIRQDADAAVAKIVVSHKVRKKASGPLHEGTYYGDTGQTEETDGTRYSLFVTREKVENLTKSKITQIRDDHLRGVIETWIADHGGEIKKAFPPYPRLGTNGPEVRKVRLCVKRQMPLMRKVNTGYAELGLNHHIAIYREPDGKTSYEIVSLFEAARRLARHEPIVRRKRDGAGEFVMSLAPGDAIEYPNGEKKGIWIVTGVWANGPIVIERTSDAAHETTTRPNANSLMRSSARKVSIDPVGRLRPARD